VNLTTAEPSCRLVSTSLLPLPEPCSIDNSRGWLYSRVTRALDEQQDWKELRG